MTKPMDSGDTITPMVLNMKASGKKISSTVMERRPGQMALAMRVSTRKERKMVMANSLGQMVPPIKVSLLTITSRG